MPAIPDRVRQTVRSGLLLSLGATALLTALVQLAAAPIIALFEPENAAVTAEGVRYLRICCSVNGLIYAAMYVFDSFAIGSGASWVAMCNAMLDAALLRLPLCWLLAFPPRPGPRRHLLGPGVSPPSCPPWRGCAISVSGAAGLDGSPLPPLQ